MQYLRVCDGKGGVLVDVHLTVRVFALAFSGAKEEADGVLAGGEENRRLRLGVLLSLDRRLEQNGPDVDRPVNVGAFDRPRLGVRRRPYLNNKG